MISVQNLTFTYPGASEPAVKGIDFEIADGEVFGFLGPSGAGKSTTQKVLIGLLKEFQGQIAVFGRDLHSWKNDYFEKVGVAFELPNHYQKLTGLENLQLFAALYTGKTQDPLALLEKVGLGGDAQTRVGQYSKGMQMRLNFVRAMLHQPDLLFLDEPTAGLDPVNARKVIDIVKEQKARGGTIFLTTHNMAVADELCDRVAFIVDGKIALIDSPRSLKLQHGQRQVKVEYHTDKGAQQESFDMAGLGENGRFLELLRTYSVETIHTQEATLEDIFITATGRRLA